MSNIFELAEYLEDGLQNEEDPDMKEKAMRILSMYTELEERFNVQIEKNTELKVEIQRLKNYIAQNEIARGDSNASQTFPPPPYHSRSRLWVHSNEQPDGTVCWAGWMTDPTDASSMHLHQKRIDCIDSANHSAAPACNLKLRLAQNSDQFNGMVQQMKHVQLSSAQPATGSDVDALKEQAETIKETIRKLQAELKQVQERITELERLHVGDYVWDDERGLAKVVEIENSEDQPVYASANDGKRLVRMTDRQVNNFSQQEVKLHYEMPVQESSTIPKTTLAACVTKLSKSEVEKHAAEIRQLDDNISKRMRQKELEALQEPKIQTPTKQNPGTPDLHGSPDQVLMVGRPNIHMFDVKREYQSRFQANKRATPDTPGTPDSSEESEGKENKPDERRVIKKLSFTKETVAKPLWENSRQGF